MKRQVVSVYTSKEGTCLEDGCSGQRWGRGLCRSHYERLMRQLRKDKKALLKEQLEAEAFEAELGGEPIDYDDFWLWVKKELNLNGS